ncbi:hemolysin family protein, partial [bacterium]|nr:hemolysin family protein [bacterium]
MIYLVGAAAGFSVLLFFSAVFSGSETAFFSLSRLEISEMDDRSRIKRLMDSPDRLLITILLGNTLVNVAASSLGAVVALSICRSLGFSEPASIAIEVGVITFVILVVGEVAPKMYAMQHNLPFAHRSAPVLAAIRKLLGPVVGALHAFVSRLGRLDEGEAPFVTADELRTMVAISEHEGTLEEDEREMIDSVMEFGDIVVHELMVPRVDMECFDETTAVAEAIVGFREHGFSRMPVYHEDIDHITGVLYAKDLLKLDLEQESSTSIRGLIRDATFTPESKNAGELLREFQHRRIHIAIVVDEYGGTAGVVTMEDLIEEIVGEIRDEHDDEERPLFRVMDSKTLMANGAIRLDVLADELDVREFGSEDVETLGGYLMEAFGRIPSVGEKLEREGLEFTVEELDEQR